MHTGKIIDKFYNRENGALRSILLTHSRMVAEKTISIAKAHPELNIDTEFVYDASMLHDIGIIMCHAPAIECYGTEPYIRHGISGGKMLREYALEFGMTSEEIEPYARVCERHTGAGLTVKQIEERHLPLPLVDFLPETIEEKLICYADKFYSKTKLEEEKPLDRVINSMNKFGADTELRFMKLHELFR